MNNEEKIYTCKDLSEGRVACINDGTIEEQEKLEESLKNPQWVNIDDVLANGIKNSRLNTETPKEIKVGDYIRGFKFDDGEYNYVPQLMNRFIDCIGKVVEIIPNQKYIAVTFGVSETKYYYPKDQAIEHLVTDYTTLSKLIDDIPKSDKPIDVEPPKDFKFHELVVKRTDTKIDKETAIEIENTKGFVSDSYFINANELNNLVKNTDESYTKDNINPSHYKSKSKETIERIQDNLTSDEFKGYLKGNILKYIDRYENKNGVEDLKKANWYLNKLIEIETK